MHTRIPLSEPERWRRALDGIPHAFAHSWDGCRAMQLTSALETFLYCYDDGAARIVCPFSVRSFAGRSDLLTPYGFSGFVGTGACAGFPARWAEFARAEGFVCGYVGLHPVLDPGLFRADESHVQNSVFLLDLTLGAAELFGRMSVNRRRQVREWERGAVKVVTDRARLGRFFSKHLTAFLDERRAARIYYLSVPTLDALFASDDVILLGAETDGELEAVSVFAHTPYIADYLFNVSIPSGRRHSAPLIWHGAQRLKALGAPLLNLGGGIRPGDGVAGFKERFGGREVPLRSLRQVYRPAIYEELCRLAAVPSVAAGGYFPPYHAL